MFTIYVYVLDTLADWEIGYVTAELKSGRFFKEDAPSVSLKTVSDSKEPVHTMGGLTIVPDCLVEDIVVMIHSVRMGKIRVPFSGVLIVRKQLFIKLIASDLRILCAQILCHRCTAS